MLCVVKSVYVYFCVYKDEMSPCVFPFSGGYALLVYCTINCNDKIIYNVSLCMDEYQRFCIFGLYIMFCGRVCTQEVIVLHNICIGVQYIMFAVCVCVCRL